MKKGTDNRIRVCLEGLRENTNYERLFRALSLILSEEDLVGYLSSNQDNILSSSLEKCDEESNILTEKLVNF